MTDHTFGEVLGGRPEFRMRLWTRPEMAILTSTSHAWVCPTCDKEWTWRTEAVHCYESHGGKP